MEKPTTELLNILNHTGTGEMDDFIENYGKTDMNHAIFSEYMAQQNMTASAIVKGCRGLISKSYVYDILGGVKTNPSRDIVLPGWIESWSDACWKITDIAISM